MSPAIKNFSKKYKVKGKNNTIIGICGNHKKSIFLSNSEKINIKGNNNQIIFDYSLVGKIIPKIPSGIKININGNNNIIKIEAPIKFNNSHIFENGDNNLFQIETTPNLVFNARFFSEEGSSIIIKKNCSFKAGGILIVANNNYKNKSKVLIGNDCYFAKDVIIRTSNGHTLVDAKTGEPLKSSESKDVIIEDKVWITSRSIVLRGAHISKGSIVGANSLVNKEFYEQNVILAGTPAKIIKHDTTWDCRNYQTYIEDMINNK